MEELSVYRQRIGIFVDVAIRRSSQGKKPKRSQRTSAPLKSVSPKQRMKPKVKLKVKVQRRPSRLGVLLLLLLIPMACLPEEKGCCVPSESNKIAIYSNDTSSESCIHIEETPKPSMLDVELPGRLFLVENFETRNQCIPEIFRDLLICSDNFVDDIKTNISERVDDTTRTTYMNKPWRMYVNSLFSSYHHIAVCIILLCCLRTFSYLLGNKGAHIYNGNMNGKDEPQRPGDAWLTKQTLSLIKQNVDESVGLITLKTTLAVNGDEDKTYSNTGTGFRVGSCYLMTAYHVFREKIEKLVNDMCFMMPAEDIDKVFWELSSKLNITYASEKTPSISDVHSILDSFNEHTATNIPLLIKLLNSIINTESIIKSLRDEWTQKCFVEFLLHGRFSVDWKIVFGDKNIDIVIVKLIETDFRQTLPKRMLLDEHFSNHLRHGDGDIHIMRFNQANHIVMDQNTKIFENDEQLQHFLTTAVHWWNTHVPHAAEYIHSMYQDCSVSHNEETGRVVLRASKSFTHGASGAPIVYLFNKDGQPVVGMIYQRGYPSTFYLNKRFREIDVDKNKCLLEGGTTMKKLAQVLYDNKQIELKREIFSLPDDKEFHAVRAIEIREIKELKESLETFKVMQLETSNTQKDLIDTMERFEQKQDSCFARFDALTDNTASMHTQEDLIDTIERFEQKQDSCFARFEALAGDMASMQNFINERGFTNVNKLNNMILSSSWRQKAVPKKEQTDHSTQFIELETSSYSYVRTEAYQKAETILQNSNILFIIGNPGDGKTALAYQLMKSWSQNNSRCLKPLILRNADNFLELVTQNKALCVLIDDIFGSVVTERPKALRWGEEFGVFMSMFQPGNSSVNNVLILSSRKDVFYNCPYAVRASSLFNEKNTLDLSLKELLSKESMRLILNSYLPESDYIEKIGEKEIKSLEKYSLKIGFPQCCRMLRENETLRNMRHSFFEKPYAFLLEELKKVLYSDNGKDKYCTLVILLLHPQCYIFNELELDLKTQLIVHCLKDLYGYNWESHFHLRQALYAMRECYVQCEGENGPFVFSHESVQTAVAYSFASSYTSHFIKLCDPTDLKRLTTNKSCSIETENILISESDITCLIKRIMKLLTSKEERIFKNIASMQVWDEESFTLLSFQQDRHDLFSADNMDENGNSMIVHFTEGEKLHLVEKLLSTSKFEGLSKEQTNRAFSVSCKTGNYKLLCLFLSKAVDPDIDYFVNAIKGRNIDIMSKMIDMFPETIQTGRILTKLYPRFLPTTITVLHQACYQGQLDMVKLICLKCKNLANERDSDGRTVLHIACFQGHTEICEYLIQMFPFLLKQSYKGILPIHEATASGNISCFQTIENYIIDLADNIETYMEDAVTNAHESVLHVACREGKEELTKYILLKYPFLLQMTKCKHPLYLVAWSGNIKLFQQIMSTFTPEYENSLRKCLFSLHNTHGSTVLHWASYKGEIEMCKYILKECIELINIRDQNGLHALHCAASSGDIECFKLLQLTSSGLSKDIDLLSTLLTNENYSVLHYASFGGKAAMCKYICQESPDLVTLRNEKGVKPIHTSAYSGDVDCFILFTEKLTPNFDSKTRQKYISFCLDSNGGSVLHHACLAGNTTLCRYIVENYANLLDICTNNGEHVLHAVSSSGNIDCLQFMIEKVTENIDPRQRKQFVADCLDNNGFSILYHACQSGKTKMCRYIIENFTNLLVIRSNTGRHILHAASTSGDIACLESMIETLTENIEPRKRKQFVTDCLDNNGSSILYHACLSGKTKMCRYIVENYPNLLGIRSTIGQNVLHAASRSGDIICLQFMIEKVTENIDPGERKQFVTDCLDNNGFSILHHACLGGKTKMCQYIVENYSNLLGIRSTIGQTVLHVVSLSGDINCLQFMIEKVTENIDPGKKKQFVTDCLDNNGFSILSHACLGGKTKMCRYIIENYPNLLGIRCNTGRHVLHAASTSGDIACLESMIETLTENIEPRKRKQFVTDCLDNNGSSILYHACLSGKTKMCRYIIENYPNLLGIRSTIGQHVLHAASHSGDIICLQFMIEKVTVNIDPRQRKQFVTDCLDNKGFSILHYACLRGKTTICRYIIENYPNLLGIRSTIGKHVLHAASHSGDIICLQFMIEKVTENIDPRQRKQFVTDCLDNNGFSILYHACLGGKTKMCRYIIENYPNLLGISSTIRQHVLHLSSLSGDINCLQFMIEKVTENIDPGQRKQFVTDCLDNNGSSILYHACLSGKTKMCRYIVENYPNLLGIRSTIGQHVLHAASSSGDIICLQFMIEKVTENIDPGERKQFVTDCLDNNGFSILYHACLGGKTKMCRYITENYPNLLGIRSTIGQHVLHAASHSGDIICLQFMIEKVTENIDPGERKQFVTDCLDNNGFSILYHACLGGKTKMCRFIVENYPNLPVIVSTIGQHVLHAASRSRDIICLQFMIEKVTENIDPGKKKQFVTDCLDNNGSSILYHACLSGKTKMCRYIVENYPNLLGIRSTIRQHVLHAASSSGDIICLQFMIEKVTENIDLGQRKQFVTDCLDNNGSSILYHACLSGKTKMCRYIVENYPNLLGIRSIVGEHVLHAASRSGDIICLQFMIEKVTENIDPRQRKQFVTDCLDNNGFSILYHACLGGKTKMCRYIIENYPNLLGISSTIGKHVLHLSSLSGDINCLQFMIEKVTENIDPGQRKQFVTDCLDNNGSSILYHACLSGKTKMCRYIVENYPNLLGIRSTVGEHVLHAASRSGDIICLQFMIEKVTENIDPRQRKQFVTDCLDNNGFSILYHACLGGKTKMCRYIIENYPNLIGISSTIGKHVLHLSSLSGDINCLQFMIEKVTENIDPGQRKQFVTDCLDNNGSSILYHACLSGKTKMCRYIVENYPNLLGIRSTIGQHVLHAASSSGDIICLQFMIEKVTENIDPGERKQFVTDCLDNNGFSILYHACLGGKTKMCRYITENYPNLLGIRSTIGQHVLHAASHSGDIICLQFMIEKGTENIDPGERKQFVTDCLDNNGFSILYHACLGGKTKMCRFIVENYPNLPVIVSTIGQHVLHAASRSGDIICLQFMIEKVTENIDPGKKKQFVTDCLDNNGSSILYHACLSGKTKMCRYIVENYPNLLGIRSTIRQHVLHAASSSGDIICLQFMIEKVTENIDLGQRKQFVTDCLDNNGSSILYHACLSGKTKMCRYIVENYPNLLGIRSTVGEHVLHAASRSGDIICLQFMIEKVTENIDPGERRQFVTDCLDNNGFSILYHACLGGKTKMCRYIIENYPNLLGIRSTIGQHVLHAASHSGDIICLQFMIEKVTENIDPGERKQFVTDCLDNNGFSILYHACLGGKTKMCRFIVENYPNLPDIRSTIGQHVLHAASRSGDIICLQFMIENVTENIDPGKKKQFVTDCLDNNGFSILYHACLGGKTKMCRYIVENYPNLPDIRSTIGQHVLHAASHSGDIICLQFMIEKVTENIDPGQRKQFVTDCLDNNGFSILYHACLGGKTKMCRYIIENYPNLLGIRSTIGEHVLHFASLSGDINCLQFMIEKVTVNIDPIQRKQFVTDCLDNKGFSILHYACLRGKTTICRYIIENYPNLLGIRSTIGEHVLHAASHFGDIICLQFMIEKVTENIDPGERKQFVTDCLDNNGSSILYHACLSGKTKMCRYIVENYPNLLGIRSTIGQHVLHAASSSGDIICLQFMIEKVTENIDPGERKQFVTDCLDNNGFSILYHACLGGKTKMCRYITENYPNLLGIRSTIGQHVLHAASHSGDIICLQFMIEKVTENIDPGERKQFVTDCLDNNGFSILYHACLGGKTKMCRFIVENYPNLPGIVSTIGQHVLHAASRSGDIICLQFMIEKVTENIDPGKKKQFVTDCLDNNGSSILYHACLSGKTKMCRYIVENYPNLLGIRSTIGQHVLHAASSSGDIICLQFMIEKVTENIDLGQRKQFVTDCLDNNGSSILYHACLSGKTKMCRYIGENYPNLLGIRSTVGEHVLHAASHSGDIICLQFMIEKVTENIDPGERRQFVTDCLDNNGFSILYHACLGGKTKMCRYIIENYPNLLGIRSTIGQHVLHAASHSGDIICLQFMIEKVTENIDPGERKQFVTDCLDNNGFSILYHACLGGKTKMCRYIIENYPNLLGIRSTNGQHVLHAASHSGDIICLQFMIEKVTENIDPGERKQFVTDCLDNNGFSILYHACLGGKTKMCRYIVENYPNLPDIRSTIGQHVLHAASHSGDIICLQFMIEKVTENIDPGQRKQFVTDCLDNNGFSILYHACLGGKTKMCRYIIENYPNLLGIRSTIGEHVLHFASLSGDINCLQFMIEKVTVNIDPIQRKQFVTDCLDNKGFSILHYACLRGKTTICRYIIENYPNLLGIRSTIGEHVLHAASHFGDIICLQFMIEKMTENIDPGQRKQFVTDCLDNNGSSILYHACLSGKTKMCRYIVENYPNLLGIRSTVGEHVLHAASHSGDIICLQFMIEKVTENIDPGERKQFVTDCLDNNGFSILYHACVGGKTKMCQYIVENYPNLIGIRSTIGKHVLHAASHSGDINCLHFMIEKVTENIDPRERKQFVTDCLDNNGSSILYHACLRGTTNICRYIIENYPNLLGVRSTIGEHVLHAASHSGDIICLQFIIEKVTENIDPGERKQFVTDCLDNNGFSILYHACLGGKTKMCRYIVENYPNILGIRSNIGRYVLHAASESGDRIYDRKK